MALNTSRLLRVRDTVVVDALDCDRVRQTTREPIPRGLGAQNREHGFSVPIADSKTCVPADSRRCPCRSRPGVIARDRLGPTATLCRIQSLGHLEELDSPGRTARLAGKKAACRGSIIEASWRGHSALRKVRLLVQLSVRLSETPRAHCRHLGGAQAYDSRGKAERLPRPPGTPPGCRSIRARDDAHGRSAQPFHACR